MTRTILSERYKRGYSVKSVKTLHSRCASGPVTKSAPKHCRRRRKETLTDWFAGTKVVHSQLVDQSLLTSSPTSVKSAWLGAFVTGPALRLRLDVNYFEV